MDIPSRLVVVGFLLLKRSRRIEEHSRRCLVRAGLYRQLALRPVALLDLPISGCRPYQFYAVNRRAYRLYRFTILPISAPYAGLRRQLAHRPMNLLVRHFIIFTYYISLFRFTPTLSPSASKPIGFTIFTNLAPSPCLRPTPIIPLANEPTGLTDWPFSNFSAHAGLYRQVVRRPMALLVFTILWSPSLPCLSCKPTGPDCLTSWLAG